MVDVAEAQVRLDELVDRAQGGEGVLLSRDGRPVARLSGVAAVAAAYGSMRGHITISDDFDELPTDIAEAFGALPES